MAVYRLGGVPTNADYIDFIDSPELVLESELATAVEALVNQILDGAPGSLDTLKELAASIGNDSDFVGTVLTALEGKVDSETFAEVVATLSTKTELSDAVAPLATKTELSDAISPLATKTELSEAAQSAINQILDGAPNALDTLNELSAAIGDDADFAGSIVSALSGKVDQSTYDSVIATLATTAYVDSAVAPLASTLYVDSAVSNIALTPGPTGPAGADGEDGIDAFEYSTQRVLADQYQPGEIVFYAGSYWVCIASNDALPPSTSPDYWAPYSFQGPAGVDGQDGVTSGLRPVQVRTPGGSTPDRYQYEDLTVPNATGTEIIEIDFYKFGDFGSEVVAIDLSWDDQTIFQAVCSSWGLAQWVLNDVTQPSPGVIRTTFRLSVTDPGPTKIVSINGSPVDIDGVVGGIIPGLHPVTLNGPQTVDGISVTPGQRVLVTDQTDPMTNGIYEVSSGAWQVAADWQALPGGIGALVYVIEGSTFGDQWLYRGTDLVWTQFVGLPGQPGQPGQPGSDGAPGIQGEPGSNGLSAYEIAVSYGGFDGTENDWLASLQGATGLSAYELALDGGFQGTQEDWLASLAGPTGPQGDPGSTGPSGVVTATAPLTYDSGSQTVALSYGSGLGVVGGQLVATGTSGSSVREAVVTAYNVPTRTATVTYSDNGTSGTALNKTAFQLYVNDLVAVASTTVTGTNVVVSVVPVGTANSVYHQQIVKSGYPNLWSGTLGMTPTLPVSIPLDTIAVDTANALGYGSGWIVTVRLQGSATTVSPSIRVVNPNNMNDYVDLPQLSVTGVITTATIWDGKIVATAATSATNPTGSIWVFNPSTGTWTNPLAAGVAPTYICGKTWNVNGRLWALFSIGTTGSIAYPAYMDAGATSWTHLTSVTSTMTGTTSSRFSASAGGMWMWNSNAGKWFCRPTDTTSQWTDTGITISPGSIAVPAINSAGHLWFPAISTQTGVIERLVKLTPAGAASYDGVFPSTTAAGAPFSQNLIQQSCDMLDNTTIVFGGTLAGDFFAENSTNVCPALWVVSPTGNTRVWTGPSRISSNRHVDVSVVPGTKEVLSHLYLGTSGNNVNRVDVTAVSI